MGHNPYAGRIFVDEDMIGLTVGARLEKVCWVGIR